MVLAPHNGSDKLVSLFFICCSTGVSQDHLSPAVHTMLPSTVSRTQGSKLCTQTLQPRRLSELEENAQLILAKLHLGTNWGPWLAGGYHPGCWHGGWLKALPWALGFHDDVFPVLCPDSDLWLVLSS